MRFALLLAISLHASVASAATIDLGLGAISIPAPEGYTYVERDGPFARLWLSPSPANDQLAVFVSNDELANFNADAGIAQYCYVQQSKRVKGRFIFPADLKEIAAYYRKQGQLNVAFEQGLREAQSNLSATLGANVSISEPTMLPMFYEGRDVICSTLVGTLEMTDGNTTTKAPFATSMGMLIVRGNLITLYATDKLENMEKTRAVIRDWVEQVFTGNPPTILEKGRYLFPGSSANGFDYWKIFVASLKGAAIGLLVYGFRRWNSGRRKGIQASSPESR